LNPKANSNASMQKRRVRDGVPASMLIY